MMLKELLQRNQDIFSKEQIFIVKLFKNVILFSMSILKKLNQNISFWHKNVKIWSVFVILYYRNRISIIEDPIRKQKKLFALLINVETDLNFLEEHRIMMVAMQSIDFGASHYISKDKTLFRNLKTIEYEHKIVITNGEEFIVKQYGDIEVYKKFILQYVLNYPRILILK